MQSIRNSILSHVRVGARRSAQTLFTANANILKRLGSQMSASTDANNDQIMDRVIGLVKKFDKIDASKSKREYAKQLMSIDPEQVTETADFQKDLSLDSLDRVELVMAFEEEFSMEIPDEKADKLTCCADVARYIASGAGKKMNS